MSVELRISDVREKSLDFARCGSEGPLQGFFQLGWYRRTLENPTVLGDCSFFDMRISYDVRDWPGMPHPGIFGEFFPTILSRLLGSSNSLTLFVDGERDHFDPFDTIDKLLWPKNLRYVLLPNPPNVKPHPRIPYAPGRLIFEWPADALGDIVRDWFESPAIEIDGYVASEPPLGLISNLCFRPQSEERVRELLRGIEFGFRLWRDNNGLLILTDKLRKEDLEDRLQLVDLNSQIQAAVPRYEQGGNSNAR